MHCWWECKLIDHYGEQHGDSLNKLGIKLPYDLAIQLLGIYPEKTINQNYNASKNINGTPLQYSCMENPMDGGAWQAAVHGFAKSWTRLSDFTFTFHFHALEQPAPVFLPGESQGWWSLMGCHLWGRTELDTTEVTQQQQQQQLFKLERQK